MTDQEEEGDETAHLRRDREFGPAEEGGTVSFQRPDDLRRGDPVTVTGDSAVDWTRLSRTLAHMLRHAPGEYGVSLSPEGWAPVSDVVEGLARRRRWSQLSEGDVRDFVQQHDTGRYEIQGDRIRARYGHSIRRRPDPESVEPPPLLYHGTTPTATAAILSSGLKPMDRQHVHLAETVQEAERAARRRTDSPAILEIDARTAAASGVAFHTTGGPIWLSTPVPPEFISVRPRED